MSDYGYERFTAQAYDLKTFTGPALGTKAPDFAVSLVDGTPRQLLEFDGQFLVLELGSVTCPLFQSRRGSMAQLVTAHPDVDFTILYVREAHPGAGVSQHKSIADKQACATRLARDDGENRLILLDDLAGTVHQAYGRYPNSVFILNRNHCVLFHADWNNPSATARALAALKAGRPAGGPGLFRPPLPPVAIKTLRRAGAGAATDFIKDLPNLIWNNIILRNLRLLGGRPQKVLPDHRC